MKIGIIGTRGIPNKYGGFEQFAMYFAEYLVQEGFEVTVYNSSDHPYQANSWRGVTIQPIFDPERHIGTFGQFVYDFLSILNSRKKHYDVIFQLGYTSSSIWGWLFPKKARIITNMDGLEWKRTKYNKWVQAFLKTAEKWAVKQSDCLIADSIGIQTYLKQKYQAESVYIPYGATVFEDHNKAVLANYSLKPFSYNLVIARLVPENNVETIIKGHLDKNSTPLCIIGNFNNKYGLSLVKKYNQKVIFLGAIYDINQLNNLRYYSNLYFHGHSVGGTNPSLLEAMACSCLIIAHDNPFNRAVLAQNAYYFTSEMDIQALLGLNRQTEQTKITNNLHKIESVYSYELIHQQLKNLIKKVAKKNK
ncbi:DUF1972 domain-containing protein [Aureispira anguillae]|uniref:DUF1972 domain-containing protein n=1 Tax=Aureispira anguillae TaxID=2864201 RepID=A0A915Y9P0_9BACT|nr:DUF1972 domain-containing protein [Aureispira anguillae]BDS09653.1 DUF1972 domain-containing protein [Aureispira anguillae]